jgi:hypothetical protein
MLNFTVKFKIRNKIKYLKAIVSKDMLHLSITTLDETISKIYHKKIRDRLPISLKKLSFHIFYAFKLYLLVRIKNLKMSIYYVVGSEQQNQSKLTIMFIGEKKSLDYLSSILFSEEPKVEFLEEVYIWNIPKKLHSFSKKLDAVFVKTDRFFSRFLKNNGFIILPEWIEMELDISDSLNNIYKNFSKSARDDVRKIKNIEYNYELSTDTSKFEDFYQTIYYPFIIQRYEHLTIPEATNYPEIKAMFENGYLLLVKEKDRIVSGFILVSSGKTAFFTYAGVNLKDGYLSKGAGSALYYFFIKWTKEHDFNLLKFGGARPFFEDGLFQYKKKWGMTAKISNNMFGVFGCKIINSKTKAISDFLINNPFVYIEEGKLKGMIYIKKIVNRDDVQQIWKKYYTLGLSELTIISIQKINDDVKSFVSSNYNGKIIVRENLLA